MAMIYQVTDIIGPYHTRYRTRDHKLLISYAKSYMIYEILYDIIYENSARNGSAMILDMIWSMIS